MTALHINKLPAFFYDIRAPERWRDKLANQDGNEKLILSFTEIMNKGRRQDAYTEWLERFNLPPRKAVFQVVQVLSAKHSESNRKDWWPQYQDCLFRVFVTPLNQFEGNSLKQWYIVCPEDCELLHRYEWSSKHRRHFPVGRTPANPWISNIKELRKVRLLPTECCRHWRHETFAGQLPEGL